jgi:protein-S-isoprenylcysteine O-methyltransferase Ste14
MYVGFVLVLLGWAVFLSNPATLIVMASFIVYLRRFQIDPEELALVRAVGITFGDYRNTV